MESLNADIKQIRNDPHTFLIEEEVDENEKKVIDFWWLKTKCGCDMYNKK